MIRHIVAFRFTAETAEEKARVAEELRAHLEPLKSSVPRVLSLRVNADAGRASGHFDAVLESEHPSFEDLADYQVHPAHVEALAWVSTVVSDKAVVDYEA